MKKFRIVIAVLLVLAITAACFAACKKKNPENATVTVAVTDENGEPVTDENGEPLTEVVTTAADGENVSVNTDGENAPSVTVDGGTTAKGQSTTAGKNSQSTTQKGKETVTKPKAPKAPSSIKASKVTENSVELTWSKVDCNGYLVYLFDATGSRLKTETTTKTSFTFKDLASNTVYYFAVQAYNENKAGKAQSDLVQTKSVKTKVNETARKRKIVVNLPTDANQKKTLKIYIQGEGEKTANLVKTVDVNLGNNSKYEFTTDKKYKGVILVYAEIENYGSNSVSSDKDEIVLDISLNGIDQAEDPVPFD